MAFEFNFLVFFFFHPLFSVFLSFARRKERGVRVVVLAGVTLRCRALWLSRCSIALDRPCSSPTFLLLTAKICTATTTTLLAAVGPDQGALLDLDYYWLRLRSRKYGGPSVATLQVWNSSKEVLSNENHA